MSILSLVIIGAAAGLLATRLMRVEASLAVTVLIGMAGAVLGGLVLNAVLSVLGMMAGFIGALLGAMVLIWLWQRYAQH